MPSGGTCKTGVIEQEIELALFFALNPSVVVHRYRRDPHRGAPLVVGGTGACSTRTELESVRMAEEAPELTTEELELQAKQAAKQRQTEYRKTAKLLKSKKPHEKLEAIEKLSDHGYISEVGAQLH